jgi:thioredoxin reductase (NADPH)
MSIIDVRREQLLPKLTQREIDRLRRGEVSRYPAGRLLFSAGEPSPGMFVLLSGSIAVTRRDRLGHVATIVELEPGHFLAEIGDLSGRPALVDAQAVSRVEALLIPPQGLRSVLIAETELGDKIMRTFIVRRRRGPAARLSRSQRLPTSGARLRRR